MASDLSNPTAEDASGSQIPQTEKKFMGMAIAWSRVNNWPGIGMIASNFYSDKIAIIP